MSAKDACMAIHEKSKTDAEAIADAATAFSPASLVSAIGGAFGGTNKSTSTSVNKITATQAITQLVENETKCLQQLTSIQKNVVTADNTQCMSAMIAYLESPAGMQLSEAGKKEMMDSIRITIEGVTLESSSRQISNCTISATLKQMAKSEVSVDNLALQKALQSAKGMGASNETEKKMCNVIDVSVNACQYMKQQQCCNTSLISDQENVLNIKCGATVKDVSMKQQSEQRAQCNLTGSLQSEVDSKTKVKNVVKQISDQISTGLDATAFIILFLVLLLLGLGIGVYVAKSGNSMSARTKTIIFMGIGLTLNGFGGAFLYHADKETQGEVEYNDRRICTASKIFNDTSLENVDTLDDVVGISTRTSEERRNEAMTLMHNENYSGFVEQTDSVYMFKVFDHDGLKSCPIGTGSGAFPRIVVKGNEKERESQTAMGGTLLGIGILITLLSIGWGVWKHYSPTTAVEGETARPLAGEARPPAGAAPPAG